MTGMKVPPRFGRWTEPKRSNLPRLHWDLSAPVSMTMPASVSRPIACAAGAGVLASGPNASR